jgi:hypothetical protein
VVTFFVHNKNNTTKEEISKQIETMSTAAAVPQTALSVMGISPVMVIGGIVFLVLAFCVFTGFIAMSQAMGGLFNLVTQQLGIAGTALSNLTAVGASVIGQGGMIVETMVSNAGTVAQTMSTATIGMASQIGGVGAQMFSGITAIAGSGLQTAATVATQAATTYGSLVISTQLQLLSAAAQAGSTAVSFAAVILQGYLTVVSACMTAYWTLWTTTIETITVTMLAPLASIVMTLISIPIAMNAAYLSMFQACLPVVIAAVTVVVMVLMNSITTKISDMATAVTSNMASMSTSIGLIGPAASTAITGGFQNFVDNAVDIFKLTFFSA